ncbi:MAG: hypothetical protein LH645_02355 [Actinomycetia bacterium]|nr:hypothetical protein [Actinomycetes bacterium]
MRARTLAAVAAGFGLGALAAFALSLVRRPMPIDTTGYQPPTPADGPAAGDPTSG